jgi:hypothetical protein
MVGKETLKYPLYPSFIMKHLPQELEVWYLIPALRRELAKAFISEFKLTQKQVADKMRVTESAISQYINEKRASGLKFNDKEQKIITKVAKKIIQKNLETNEELYKLSKKFKGTDSLCEFHRKHDPSIEKNCDLCN